MADLKNFMVGDDINTIEQINTIVNSPAHMNEKIRIMCDAHAGMSSPIGFTSTYYDKIIPSVVGVDIACRVSMFKIPSNIDLERLDQVIHETVPAGFAVHNKPMANFDYCQLRCWHNIPYKARDRIKNSLGSLGGGKRLIASV